MYIRLASCVVVGVLLLAAQAPKQTAAGDAAKGKAVFADQCAACHALDSTKKLGPGMKGFFKKAKLANGKALNEAAVRVLIDAGGNGMPPYKDLLTPAQKNDLIAYLKTL